MRLDDAACITCVSLDRGATLIARLLDDELDGRSVGAALDKLGAEFRRRLAGGSLRTGTRSTLNQQTDSARLYERSS